MGLIQTGLYLMLRQGNFYDTGMGGVGQILHFLKAGGASPVDIEIRFQFPMSGVAYDMKPDLHGFDIGFVLQRLIGHAGVLAAGRPGRPEGWRNCSGFVSSMTWISGAWVN